MQFTNFHTIKYHSGHIFSIWQKILYFAVECCMKYMYWYRKNSLWFRLTIEYIQKLINYIFLFLHLLITMLYCKIDDLLWCPRWYFTECNFVNSTKLFKSICNYFSFTQVYKCDYSIAGGETLLPIMAMIHSTEI